MHAAVVRSFDSVPVYDEVADPVPTGAHDLLVDVVAAGLHPRVRSQADGSHYTSTGVLPLVPGIDGVGRRPDGALVYFALDDTAAGSMAERTVIDTRRSITVPSGADPGRIAAGMNPGMSSWIALTRRLSFAAGGAVLVLGATGNAGRMAVQIARHLGAATVVAAGRNRERLALLPALGADVVVPLTGDIAGAEALGAAAGDVDVVLDYIWGPPALAAMTALVRARPDRSRRLDWIQIGAQAGPTVDLPSALLRQADLCVMGSGQGSIGVAGMLEELPSLAAAIADGAIDVAVQPVLLSEVARVWSEPTPADRRIVVVP